MNISIAPKMKKNGKYTTAPGLGIHLVFSVLTVYPDLQTTNDGSHVVPESSISYPNGH